MGAPHHSRRRRQSRWCWAAGATGLAATIFCLQRHTVSAHNAWHGLGTVRAVPLVLAVLCERFK